MKPRNKHEAWCYTLTKTKARKKAKRLDAKRNRRMAGKRSRDGGPLKGRTAAPCLSGG